MSEYIAIFEDTFLGNFKRYGALRKQIQRRVDRVIADPYHNTEPLADTPNRLNLIGCRSARIDRNFRLIFVVCEECRLIPECAYCFCDGHGEETIIFLTLGPHDRSYAME